MATRLPAKAAERNKTAWTRHLSDAKKRESRYQKSARDVDCGAPSEAAGGTAAAHSALFLRRHGYAARAKAQRRRRQSQLGPMRILESKHEGRLAVIRSMDTMNRRPMYAEYFAPTWNGVR